MNRRRFLTALGASAGASSLAIGSGAFTTVSAERTVSIDVADDFRAFLRLEPLAKEGLDGEVTGRSSTAGQTVTFDIPGHGDGENPNASGVGTDSVYVFRGLLEIMNQGTQPVTVQSEYDGDLENVAMINDDGIIRQDPPTLNVGDAIEVGLHIDTHGNDTGGYDETLTIVGERVGGNRD